MTHLYSAPKMGKRSVSWNWYDNNNSLCAPLKGHAYSHAFVAIVLDPKTKKIINVTLWSYQTRIITAKCLDYDGKYWSFDITGLYSNTTIRHISNFIKEYFPDLTYFDMKKLCRTEKKNGVFYCSCVDDVNEHI